MDGLHPFSEIGTVYARLAKSLLSIFPGILARHKMPQTQLFFFFFLPQTVHPSNQVRGSIKAGENNVACLTGL